MKDLQTIDLDLTSPGSTTNDTENERMIERFRTWWPHLPKEVRNGIRQIVRSERHREHDAMAAQLLDFLNLKRPGKRGFMICEANLKPIRDRLAEGVTPQELRGIIALKARQVAAGEFDPRYFRPQTLFRPSKCHAYRGELGAEA